MRLKGFLLLLALGLPLLGWGQKPEKPTSSEIYEDLRKLSFFGTALYVAAHPDDENTRLISYLANDVKARTAYLSLTRGDGGQNLIGPEIRELLGVIRTQELLAARATDGGSQYFTRANDFGYSKHPDETLAIWNKEEVLRDVVMNIRRFKPDIMVNRFNHRTPGTTHGHHTSSAMLSVEAFDLAGDPNAFPESAQKYGVWQPKRLFFNTSWWFYGSREKFAQADKTNLLSVETGNYFPSTGLSNGEIAALSRSMHKSQGFGSTGSRGAQTEWLEFIKGDFPENKDNLFEGVDTSWSRLEGGAAVGAIISEVTKNFNFQDPSANVPQLLEAYKLLEKLPESHWKTIKLNALKQIILDCSGIFLEAVSNQQEATFDSNPTVRIEAINRSNLNVKLNSVSSSVVKFPDMFAAMPLGANQGYSAESVSGTFSPLQEYTAPYWLKEPGTLGMYKVSNEDYVGLPRAPQRFPVMFNLSINGVNMTAYRNIVYKFNDPVDGEVYRPFDVLPEVTTAIEEKVIIFADTKSRTIPVVVRAGKDGVSATLKLNVPEGWKVSPATIDFSLKNQGEKQRFNFQVTPPNNQSEGYIAPVVMLNGQAFTQELIQIDYPHIPYQNVLMPSQAKVARIPIDKRGELIAYVKGAGDAIPESLEQIGYQVTTLAPEELTATKLAGFDALVFGVRAYNTVKELQFKKDVVSQYVANGGNVIVQYNTSRGLVTDDFAPYPLQLSRERVTDEYAPVTLLKPEHPLLNSPNKITAADFEGWVQERGLYFPSSWDSKYEAILQMQDKQASSPSQGSLLVAKHGKGHYIYTGLSFFRELPAGVPGAYRLFANLLSIGK
ncbi:PIG-L family deacetylase [Gilvibacter sediminis]|uniref:PIG-L family deacetylase n=1 Tax=Gilvibacter sediminis TaxID=379071 RepID=UPI002350FB83|nr:PIG-L family deacetylase [Gilvibacter sediminis]MDC7998188.1 PIG-L family deacetylase [Gilvibacter sediminis]